MENESKWKIGLRYSDIELNVKNMMRANVIGMFKNLDVKFHITK